MKIVQKNPIYCAVEPAKDIEQIKRLFEYSYDFWRQGQYKKIKKTTKSFYINHPHKGWFLAGTLPRVIEYCEKNNIPLEIELMPKEDIKQIAPKLPGITFRPDQKAAIDAIIKNNRGIVKAPTGCLSGNTLIRINRAKKGSVIRLDTLYKKINNIDNSKFHGPKLNLSIPTKVRSFNGKSIQLQTIINVTYSGKKQTYLIVLENGNMICATKTHKFLTNQGWKKLSNLCVGESIMCDCPKPKKSKNKLKKNNDCNVADLWHHPFARVFKVKPKYKNQKKYSKSIEKHRAIYEANLNNLSLKEYLNVVRHNPKRSENLKFIDPKKFHIHHIDGNHYNNNVDNLEQLSVSNHQKLHSKTNKFNFNQGLPFFSKIIEIKQDKIQDTYDIHCPVHHNFSANDIIVHNSGKTVVAGGVISMYPESKAVMVVHTKALFTQTIDELRKWFGDEIGFIGGGKYNPQRITVCMIQSCNKLLGNDKAPYQDNFFDLLADADVIVIDEAHHLSKESGHYTDLMKACLAPIRVGFTATPNPKTKVKARLVGEGYLGAIISGLEIDEGINNGILATPRLKLIPVPMVRIKADKKTYQNIYKEGIVLNRVRNRLIAKEASIHIRQGKSVLIMITDVVHRQAEIIQELMKNLYDTDADIVNGATDVFIQQSIKQALKEKQTCCVIVTSMWREGINIPTLNCVINAVGGKSEISILQIVGRGLRTAEGKNEIIIVDFLDPHPYLAQHTIERLKIYNNMGILNQKGK